MRALGTPPPRRGRRRRTVAILLPVVLAVVAAWLVLRFAGTALVVEEPLQPAHAIVVLGGGVPFRAMEGAALYEQGWAPEVWLTQVRLSGEDQALRRLGIVRPTDDEYSLQALLRLGVPEGRIVSLPGRNFNTADEVRRIAARLRAEGGSRVIVVTSPAHTRRVRALWRSLVGDSPAITVRYTTLDEFDGRGWWRQSADVQRVAREWAGLLNAWLGFPVRTDR